MLNGLWAGMILIGIIFGAWNGKMPELTNAALDSSKDAVSLCITMLGVMAFWCGIMEIAEKAGLVKKAAEKLRPVIRFLFPQLPVENKANEQIAINFIANILGLGWAATPAGLKAMEALGELEEDRRLGRAFGPVRKRAATEATIERISIITIRARSRISSERSRRITSISRSTAVRKSHSSRRHSQKRMRTRLRQFLFRRRLQ